MAKTNRKMLNQLPDCGPTREALRHGVVEIRPLRSGTARGVMMARRVGLHERLYARGKLTDAEWNWACRYVRESEIAAGGRPGKPEIEPIDAWTGPLIYNRQCAAAGFLRRAHARLSLVERRLLIAACVDCALMVELGPLLGLMQQAEEDEKQYSDRIKNRVNAACVHSLQRAAGSLQNPPVRVGE